MNRSSQLHSLLALGSLPKSDFAKALPLPAATAATKRQQSLPQRFAALVLLLTLTAIARPSVAVSQIAPVLAQSAPTTASTQPTAERSLPWLWLLLIPLVAGWRWSVVNRRARESANTDSVTDDRHLSVEPLEPALLPRQTSKDRLAADLDRQPVDRHESATAVELDGKSQQIDAGAVARSEPTTLQLVQELQLLEERLVVDIQRRKVGEIVVRKEIETRIVEVPIRREKLIVEQVSPEFKQLAVIDLGQSSATETVGKETAYLPTVDAKFTSIAAAVDFLKEIADREDSALQHVQMNVVLQDRPPNLND